MLVAAVFGAAAACFVRRWHPVRRHPMGGQVCSKCRGVFRDLEEAGLGDPQLHDARPKYNRDNGSFTRESGF